MKKFLSIAALVAGIAFSSQVLYAQGMGPGGCGGAGGMGYGPGIMYEDLNLTDEQADKIYKLDREFREKVWKDMPEHRKAIDKILTPEQKKKLEDARKEHFKRMSEGGKHRGKKYGNNDGRGMMVGPALDLTDDQIEKIHKINMDYADKFHKNRKNADELKKLRDSRDKEIESVLTKEQLEQLKKIREKQGDRYCPYFPED